MADKFDEQTAATKAQIEQRLLEMDAAQQDVMRHAGELLAKEYARIARETIVASPDVADRLGAEGMRELKGKVQTLIESAPAAATEELTNATIWWHRDAVPKHPNAFSELRRTHGTVPAKSAAETALRYAIARLSDVLEPAGLLTYNSRQGSRPQWLPSNSRRERDPRKIYPHRVEWSDALNKSFLVYANLYSSWLQLIRTLSRGNPGGEEESAGI